MRIQYILEKDDIKRARDRLSQLKHIALLSRDAGHDEDNREYYLRAKGFQEALEILGIDAEKYRYKKETTNVQEVH